MPIKYGELVIIYNKINMNIFTNFITWLNCDDELFDKNPPTNSKYIFSFDDGNICDYDDQPIDFNFDFFKSMINKIPSYFQKIKNKKNYKIYNKVYFYKRELEKENYNKLFSSYSKYDVSININSNYNSIYFCHNIGIKQDIFGIIGIKSNKFMPRYQFAYDVDEFTKEEIIYLIHYLFNS